MITNINNNTYTITYPITYSKGGSSKTLATSTQTGGVAVHTRTKSSFKLVSRSSTTDNADWISIGF